MLKEVPAASYIGPKQIPITPTLVIGLGKFGRHVGTQLAARLLLTEAGLRLEGLSSPLLAQVDDDGTVTPGLVRIMGLDWDQWFGNDFAPNAFLRDIKLKGPGEAERKTAPQIREDDRHPEDWIDAKMALQPMVEHMLLASLPLREHDMPMRVGDFLPPDKDHDLLIRIYVVCAAREADSAALAPRLIELLGKIYVLEGLARGVSLLCYVGGTPRAEHLEAGGSDAEYDQLFSAEVDRIIPPRTPFTPSTSGSTTMQQSSALLCQLEGLSKKRYPQIIETCYLLDTGLSNRQTVVQGRLDEPDEVVVAAALALNMFIATDGDRNIRHAVSRWWNINGTSGEPGLFASFGIASYAIDHPKLRRYVYSRVASSFLLSAQPRTEGEKAFPQGPPSGLDEEIADDPLLEAQVNRDVLKQLNEYGTNISFNSVDLKIPKEDPAKNKIDYKRASVALRHCDPADRQNVRDVLDRITAKLADEMKGTALSYRIQKQQNLYASILQSAASLRLLDQYASEQAPLTRAYRFLSNSVTVLEREAKKYKSSSGAQTGGQTRDAFVRDLEESYERAVGEKVTQLQAALLTRPGWVGAVFRRMRIRKALSQLEEKYASILQKAKQEAWGGALADALKELDSLFTQRVKPLCMPNGILSKLRDQSLADEAVAKDRVLERVFLDEQLKQDLKDFSRQLAERDALWNRRQKLLQELIEKQPLDQQMVGAWLREQAELLYLDDATLVTRLTNRFLEDKTKKKLSEMWHNLSGAAVPLLRHDIYSQDDPSLEVKLFSVHGLQESDELSTLARLNNVQVLDSADRLRWMFMNTYVGLHLDGIKFSVESLLP